MPEKDKGDFDKGFTSCVSFDTEDVMLRAVALAKDYVHIWKSCGSKAIVDVLCDGSFREEKMQLISHLNDMRILLFNMNIDIEGWHKLEYGKPEVQPLEEGWTE